jgi:glycosyltransferase involved in cell wall biosynthesis
MIVRNEEDNLPLCLESVGGLFDEIVIVDTGSTDATREIALAHGATVFEFPWIDDFAAARNEALKHSTGDYAFWLDADDRIDPPDHEKLGRLFNGLSRENRSAYVVRCACDSAPDGRVQGTVVDHVRLFPLRADVLWTYPVHEQILPALRRAGVPVEWTDIAVRHTGYVDEAVRRRKLDRDSRILERLLEESPDEPFVRFNLGFIAVEKSEWKKALGHFQASLDRSAPEDSITRKLYALIARCQQALGSPDEALATCEDGLRLDPEDAELWFRKAVVLRTTGRLDNARACWEHVLTLRRPEKFSSVDVGIYGHLTRRNLARIAEERRDWPTARLHWLETLRECPDDEEATAALRMLESHGGEGSR